ncbi:hypothetical protein JRO89_XS11G0223600 [Xanthoceras sorbifolium]|uniref:Uncharacterized protein n=1 Tax=Xanthoceras sorbifolium TaxID=99658 RepID=A0ABQ8HGV9_9ROSI|nr:hypothetical protein JRO89_XS11G0223600 [Xanthoceras sorbifolium]
MAEKSSTSSRSFSGVKFEVKSFDGKSNFTLWLKMKEGGDVIAHLNDFNWCISDLIRVNVKYEEDDKALLLLRSLPDSFKHFRTTLFFGKDTLECDAIISDIISYVKMNNASEREAQGEGFLTKESSERGRTKERTPMPEEEVNKNDDEKRIVTEIPIATKISDSGNEDVQLEEIQQEEVLEEPRSIVQGRPNRISKPP